MYRIYENLRDKIEHGKWYERAFAQLAISFLIIGWAAISFFITGMIFMGIEGAFPSEVDMFIPVFTVFLVIFALPELINVILAQNGCVGIQSKYKKGDPHIITNYDKFPHFEKMLGKGKAEEMIARENFSNYVSKSGKKSRHIKVSRSDKWVCILGGYFPIDLLCGYNKRLNELYTIDGMVIKLPKKAWLPHVQSEIETFFEDRGKYYKSVPPKAGLEFNTALRGPRSRLSKADWGRVRYLWEKSIVSSSHNYWQNNNKNQRYRPISKDGAISTTIFERVLSDREIASTAAAVTGKRVPLTRYLDFKEYQNEFCVCNGVELLKVIGNPKNMEGIDFLFECLSDVDEAYFLMAVDVLKQYPRGMCEKKIEENAQIAFEQDEVLKLAGVIYLSKELGYESRYIKQLKESASANETAMEAENTVREFELDEQALFGSEEVQKFNSGGVAMAMAKETDD
ncbi:hypothetical protein [Butyrivibrio sp. FC2001]|uniref:hypothetical protein n=1 Tax=Butyrivibrio sp. FC2001 TaxID=1280671 RepID=UPI00047B3D79|nr:hypothetical protein [Butyrivibrio sp. FC2001]